MVGFLSKLKKAIGSLTVDPGMGVALDEIRPFFDVDFYHYRYDGLYGAEEDALEHYMQAGWKLDFDPSPYFSTFYYLHKNSDVAERGVNPLAHFVLRGKKKTGPCTPMRLTGRWIQFMMFMIPLG